MMYCYSLSSSGNGLQTKITNINTSHGIFTTSFTKALINTENIAQPLPPPPSSSITTPSLNNMVFNYVYNSIKVFPVDILINQTQLLCGDFVNQTKNIAESINYREKKNVVMSVFLDYLFSILIKHRKVNYFKELCNAVLQFLQSYMTLLIIYFFSMTFSQRREGCPSSGS